MTRYWTTDEAREYLPRLGEVLGVIRQRAHREHLEAALAELEEHDVILRDPDAGLIDFQAVGDDGVVYLLCWRADEPDLAFWHLPDEGFAGRKPLPRNPA